MGETLQPCTLHPSDSSGHCAQKYRSRVALFVSEAARLACTLASAPPVAVTMRILPMTLLLAASTVRAVAHWQLSPDASSALQLDTARVGRKEAHARLLLLQQEEEERPHSPERRFLQQQQQSAHDVKKQQLLGPTVECKSWCAETGASLQESCSYRPCKQCPDCETLRKVPDCEAGEDDPQVPCVLWATQGECGRNPEFMQSSCPASCPAPCHVPERVASGARQHRVGTTQTSVVECKSWCAETGASLQETCSYRPCKQCPDCETLRKVPDCEAGEDDPQVPCVLWATQGECGRNPEFMQSSCPASCPAPCHVPERVASAARQHRVGTTQTSPHFIFSAPPAAAAAAAATLATTPATDPDTDPAAAPAATPTPAIPTADPDFAPLVDTDPGIEGDYHMELVPNFSPPRRQWRHLRPLRMNTAPSAP